jgi:diaminopimelate epimerase
MDPLVSDYDRLVFRKVHGAGNDFMLVADPGNERDWASSARLWCARRTGVGADGLVLSRRMTDSASTHIVEFWNADGSIGSMCGNALRCVAFCAAKDYGDGEMTLIMAGVPHRAVVDGDRISVTALVGPVRLQRTTVAWEGAVTAFDAINTGTEHVVGIVADATCIDVENYGRLVRFDDALQPAGANVNFVQIVDELQVRIRTYERGVETETPSCGSGAVAAVAVARYRSMVGDGKIVVHNQSSTPLTVSPGTTEGTVWLSGPVAVVFEGELL